MNRLIQRRKHFAMGVLTAMLLLASLACQGCRASYQSDDVEKSIQAICEKEYGITDVEVKIVGKTLGVYLPLKQLFSVDYESFLKGQASGELENLVSFHPEALDKVEDVLFSTSRVMLSTDRPIDFYLLEAADTLGTGLQFAIIGNILDMKRVRFWDISRDEYRKRLIHDISINQTVLWKRTVKKLFEDISGEAPHYRPIKSLETLLGDYTLAPAEFIQNSNYFYAQLVEAYQKKKTHYEVLKMKAKPLRGNEVLVYAQVKEAFDEGEAPPEASYRFKSGFIGEYLFILSLKGLEFKIAQVLPFHYINDQGEVTPLEFPNELKIYQNLEDWPGEFDFEEVLLPDFISQQLTKRTHDELSQDPRIREAFVGWRQEGKVSFAYEHFLNEDGREQEDGYFVMSFFLGLKDKLLLSVQDLSNPEMHYAMEKVLAEFLSVLQSYSFKDYTHLEVQLPVAEEPLVISRESLQKFKKKKLTLAELLAQAQPA